MSEPEKNGEQNVGRVSPSGRNPTDQADAREDVGLRDKAANPTYGVGLLGACVLLQSGGTPSKSRPDFWAGNVPWVSAKDMKFYWIEDTEDHLSETGANEATRIVEIGTTLMLVRGMTLHNDIPICRVRRPAAFNQDVKAVLARAGTDPEFVPYLLLGNKATLLSIVDSAGHGTGRLNSDTLLNLPVYIPPTNEQRAIAHILGTLDDKIELNRRMNETQEAIARAIFKSWFVDFDPVRAKASGEPPESICRRLGLTPDLLALFPDRLVDSELGEIPEGWEVTTLQNMTTKIGSGATPRGGREVYLDEGVTLIRSQNVYDSNFVWEGLAHISDEAAKQLAGVEVRAGDVLINITGASILRTCVVDPDVLPARVNQHVAIIRAKADVSSRYIHFHILQASTKTYLMGLNAGGSREAVTKGHLESVPLLNPGPELLALFQEIVAPIYSEIEQLTSQSRVLMTIRDTLLPKLLSGELRVPVDNETVEVMA